ncbi:MAG: hypothetical protein L3J46_07625 [Kangiellaceae bacterium]|nr:hypothetical protein [Kangiellaceae bacterium]
MKNEETLNLNKERELQGRIANLAREDEPRVDLWPGIKTKIEQPMVTYRMPKWIPWAIAASLIVSIGSVRFSWQNLQQAKEIYSQIKTETIVEDSSRMTQVALIEDSYQTAKASLMDIIVRSNSSIDSRLMSEIEDKLIDIELAAALLKVAIKKQPTDSQLPLLLKATYQQELEILTQIEKLDKSLRII